MSELITPLLDEKRFADLGLLDIARKVKAGVRLSLDEGRRLFDCPDVTAVGALAHLRRTSLHGERTFYVVNRHINYTNVCVNGCAFCAYQRVKGETGGFELSIKDAVDRLTSAPLTPREVHIVGGCHPDLRLSFFVDLLTSVQQALPESTLKCFTAVEIAHFAQLEGISTREVLQILKDAGLAMLPGGGAEIFEPSVRRRICPKKSTAEEWLRIHGEAHELGLATNCTIWTACAGSRTSPGRTVPTASPASSPCPSRPRTTPSGWKSPSPAWTNFGPSPSAGSCWTTSRTSRPTGSCLR